VHVAKDCGLITRNSTIWRRFRSTRRPVDAVDARIHRDLPSGRFSDHRALRPDLAQRLALPEAARLIRLRKTGAASFAQLNTIPELTSCRDSTGWSAR